MAHDDGANDRLQFNILYIYYQYRYRTFANTIRQLLFLYVYFCINSSIWLVKKYESFNIMLQYRCYQIFVVWLYRVTRKKKRLSSISITLFLINKIRIKRFTRNLNT